MRTRLERKHCAATNLSALSRLQTEARCPTHDRSQLSASQPRGRSWDLQEQGSNTSSLEEVVCPVKRRRRSKGKIVQRRSRDSKKGELEGEIRGQRAKRSHDNRSELIESMSRRPHCYNYPPPRSMHSDACWHASEQTEKHTRQRRHTSNICTHVHTHGQHKVTHVQAKTHSPQSLHDSHRHATWTQVPTSLPALKNLSTRHDTEHGGAQHVYQ